MVIGNVCSGPRFGFPKILRSMPLLRVAAILCVLMAGTFNGMDRWAVIPDLNQLPKIEDEEDEGYEISEVDQGNVVNGNADTDDDDDDDTDPSDNDDDDGDEDENIEPSSSDDESDDRDDDDDDGSAEDREEAGSDEDDEDSDDYEDDIVLALRVR